MPVVMPAVAVAAWRRFACVLFGAFLAAAGPGVASAAERQLTLDYHVYIGGFRTVDMVFDSRLAPETYAMSLRLDARGILEWLFTWNMTAASEGRVEDGRVIPVRASSRSNWQGRERRIDVHFPPGGLPVSSVDPAPHDDQRDPVPDALRHGTVDLAASIVALLRTVDATRRCDYTARVFDGRRRFDLVFTHQGQERLPANNYSAFSGPALRCGLRLARIAGFRKTHTRLGWAKTDRATVWLARLFANTRPVPVRIELETIAGALLGHVAAAKLTGDGPTRRLARLE